MNRVQLQLIVTNSDFLYPKYINFNVITIYQISGDLLLAISKLTFPSRGTLEINIFSYKFRILLHHCFGRSA